MGAVTYPDATVAALLNEQFVPVQIDVQKAPQLVEKFQVVWTPNLNLIDPNEKIIYHSEGWLAPAECAAMLRTAQGHYHMKAKRFDEAATHFSEVFERYPHSEFAPEALYYLAACRYLASHEAERLKEGWKMCRQYYPGSSWAQRTMVQ